MSDEKIQVCPVCHSAGEGYLPDIVKHYVRCECGYWASGETRAIAVERWNLLSDVRGNARDPQRLPTAVALLKRGVHLSYHTQSHDAVVAEWKDDTREFIQQTSI